MKQYEYFVYIMSSQTQTIYIGITNNLFRRVEQHKQGLVKGFTKKYKCKLLVYYEQTNDVYVAIEREKQLKKWNREKKILLIERMNPSWADLSDQLM